MSEIDSGKRKTRKPHKCHGCKETIPAGTITDYCKVADAGTVTTFYTCQRCIDWCRDKKCHECFELECAFEGFVKECMVACGVEPTREGKAGEGKE